MQKTISKSETNKYSNDVISSTHKQAYRWMIPKRFKKFLRDDEVILYACRPTLRDLGLRWVAAGFYYLVLGSIILNMLLFHQPADLQKVIFIAFIVGFLTLAAAIFLRWRNRFYMVTEVTTFASKGILHRTIDMIPNSGIQMVSIRTGFVSGLMGLNSVIISISQQGGNNLLTSTLGTCRGSITLRSVPDIDRLTAIYDGLLFRKNSTPQ
ncbi:Bacterial membrane flanked domain protein [Anaerohalosphaera lusitana]|uniref:Bacterial membrane flanked domain protein n=1 Tax=Anaerohalosphaera lusitana TaxID=1936003 RepID=A0A1U9NM92_9BACT|nr:PH domain-containing protein [Anaerohalosphaera lusitana]AQT68710.1 Bacterial membrane flanked domain protein [Anaerohalosphaera lusitana]